MTEAIQPETGFVETNETRLYYEIMGEGHPLVLIHGGYMDRRMWDDQFAVFSEHYRVIRYDVRGFGKSELPQVSYSDREDLYTLLTALGVKKSTNDQAKAQLADKQTEIDNNLEAEKQEVRDRRGWYTCTHEKKML